MDPQVVGRTEVGSSPAVLSTTGFTMKEFRREVRKLARNNLHWFVNGRVVDFCVDFDHMSEPNLRKVTVILNSLTDSVSPPEPCVMVSPALGQQQLRGYCSSSASVSKKSMDTSNVDENDNVSTHNIHLMDTQEINPEDLP